MQRMTKQRQAVLNELTRVNDFRSAQQIFEDLRTNGQHVGLATVYRSLQGLAEDGRIDALRSSEGESLYRICTSNGHHHHLVCRECGHAEEIEQSQIEAWGTSVAQGQRASPVRRRTRRPERERVASVGTTGLSSR